MTFRLSVAAILAGALFAGGTARAQQPAMGPKVTPVEVMVLRAPVTRFAAMPVESGLPRYVRPAGQIPLPVMDMYMLHRIERGPPPATGQAAPGDPAAPPATGHDAIERVVPMPRPRPPSLGEGGIRANPVASVPVSGVPEGSAGLTPARPSPELTDASCPNVKALGFAQFTPKPPIDGPGECDAAEVGDLAAVTLADGRRVGIDPPATMNCRMAEGIARWVREDLAPSFARNGVTFKTIRNYASYDCRGRNRNPLARMSEHGRANALDIRGFETPDGKWIVIGDPATPRDLMAEMKRGACERFMTVLGPGSDGFHENHIHVDLAFRSSGAKLCQWNLEPPAVAAATAAPAPAAEQAAPAAGGAPAEAVPMPTPRPKTL